MRQAFLLFLALSFAAGAVEAQDKFQRKSGLWVVSRTSALAEGKVRVTQLCIDQASDDALRQLPDGPGNRCRVDKTQRDGDKVVVDAVCELSHTETTATTHAVVTGNPDSAYKIESKSTFDPPFRGKTEGSTVLEAKWTGSCKPDMRPGDVILPNGARMNTATAEKAPANKAARKSSGDKPGATKPKGGYIPPEAK